jgi:hypothetical protein
LNKSSQTVPSLQKARRKVVERKGWALVLELDRLVLELDRLVLGLLGRLLVLELLGRLLVLELLDRLLVLGLLGRLLVLGLLGRLLVLELDLFNERLLHAQGLDLPFLILDPSLIGSSCIRVKLVSSELLLKGRNLSLLFEALSLELEPRDCFNVLVMELL